MIKIDVVDCKNCSEIYHYHRNIISIGKSNNCNIIMEDINSQLIDLIISVDKKGIYGTTIKGSHCLIHGKKLSGKKKLKKEDKITIGKTSIIIKDFSYELNSFDNQTLIELNKKALTESPGLDIILGVLSKELVELSKDIRVQK
ncbi:MAG: hypothetical protein OXB84_08700 [Halobacteriovoraceae bacterium]|nr:hypothetical protein [Halobacteriovoraceae bacterium]